MATPQQIQALIQEKQFDIKLIKELEAYVAQQVKNGTYDFDANRHLLKLYSLSTPNADVTTMILVKALMALPESHFLACSYLLPHKLAGVESIKTVMDLSTLLETCQFLNFWVARQEPKIKALVDSVKGFDDAIRNYIGVTLSTAYQSIAVEDLKKLMNMTEQKQVEEYVAAADLKFVDEGTAVAYPYKESQSIARLHTDNVSLEHVAKVLSAFSEY